MVKGLKMDPVSCETVGRLLQLTEPIRKKGRNKVDGEGTMEDRGRLPKAWEHMTIGCGSNCLKRDA